MKLFSKSSNLKWEKNMWNKFSLFFQFFFSSAFVENWLFSRLKKVFFYALSSKSIDHSIVRLENHKRTDSNSKKKTIFELKNNNINLLPKTRSKTKKIKIKKTFSKIIIWLFGFWQFLFAANWIVYICAPKTILSIFPPCLNINIKV